MTRVSFQAVSGASELAGNAFVLSSHGVHLLLDAGADRRRKAGWVDEITEPDLCWISHAHWDHIGALGPLRERFPTLACMGTKPTASLGRLALGAGGLGDARSRALASQLQSVPPRRYFSASRYSDSPGAEKFRLMVFGAGHIAGAGMLLVEIDRGDERPHRVLYTGDFCCHHQALIPGAQIPKTTADFSIDTLIMEGVLATDEAADAVEYPEELDRLRQTVAERPGGALVGVSSLSEGPEILAALAQEGADVVAHRSLEPILHAAGSGEIAQLSWVDEAGCRRALRAGRCVVAPGDQYGPGTSAGRLLDAIVSSPDGLVVILNRAHRRSSAGRMLQASAGDGIQLGKRTVELAERVEHFVLPNHAPRWQLLATVEAIQPERVVLVHGHKSGLYALKRAIEKTGYGGDILVPENGDNVALG